MKRRPLLNLATAISLACMLAIIVAWALSPWGWNRRFDPNDRSPAAEPKSHARFIASRAGSIRLIRQSVTCDLPARQLRGDAGILGYILLRDGTSVAGVIDSLDIETLDARFDRGLGFYWGDDAMSSPNPDGGTFHFEYSVTAIPYWPFLALTALAPATTAALWLRERRLRGHRHKLGLCLTCAYDLRAHTPGERCPECGTIPNRAGAVNN